MLKKFLFLILALFPLSSFALSYNGISSFMLPNVLTATGAMGSTPSINNIVGGVTTASTILGTNGQLDYFWSQLSCFQYEATQGSGIVLSGTLMTFDPAVFTDRNMIINNNWYHLGVDVVAEYQNEVDTLISLRTTNFGPGVDPYTYFPLMTVPTYPNSSGLNPHQGMLCVNPSFWIIPKTESTGNGAYLYSAKISYYQGPTGIFGYSEKNFTGFGSYGYRWINWDWTWGDPYWQSFYTITTPQFGKYTNSVVGRVINYNWVGSYNGLNTTLLGADIIRFLSSTSGSVSIPNANFVNGVGNYNRIFSSGLDNMVPNTCYSLQDGRDTSTQLITADASDIYWWKTVSCDNSFVNTSLPVWFASSYASTGSLTGGGSGSGSSGSGNVDVGSYFGECSSFLDVGCYIAGFSQMFSDKVTSFFDYLLSWIPNFFGEGGWFEVESYSLNTSTGMTNTGCIVIDENLHYRDSTNVNTIHYKSSLAPVQYVFDIVNSITGLFSVTMKSIAPSPTVCLFGVVVTVPQVPSFSMIGSGNSLLQDSYNARFGGVGSTLHTGPIQGFFDLFFVFLFTASIMFLIKPIFVIEI